MCNVIWAYGIYTDDYGVVYSEDKKELLYFPHSFSQPYYKILDGCNKISKDAFKKYPYINSCPGVEFIKQNYPISYIQNQNTHFIVCKVGKVFISKEVCRYIKEEMEKGKDLLRVISSLTYVLQYSRDSGRCIPSLITKSLYRPLCTIELPSSISFIEGESKIILNQLNLIIVPQGKAIFYKELIGKNAPIVEKQEINYKDNFCQIPTYYTNSSLLGWTYYRHKYLYCKNRYIDDITILKHISSKWVYPIILFPQNIENQIKKTIKDDCFFSKETLTELLVKDTNFCPILWKGLCKTSDNITKDERILSHGQYEYDIYAALKDKYPGSVFRNYRKGKYQPDILINIKNEIFIDIEIDEPYTANTYEAVHYIEGNDNERNQYFTTRNWTVIRFAEEQLIKSGKYHYCVDIIVAMIKFYQTGETSYLLPVFLLRNFLIEIPRWTKKEAKKMAELDLRQWDFVWNIEEIIKELEKWKAEQESLPEKPDRPEPEPDMGFIEPNDFF